DVRHDALRRDCRHAAADLHVPARTRARGLQLHRGDRCAVPGCRHPDLPRERRPLAAFGGGRRRRPVGCVDARMEHELAAARIRLRDGSRRAEPAAALGSQAPRRPGLAVRMTASPIRGRAAMVSLIVTESAFFAIFVGAYLFYIGKSLGGPTPRDVLELPIVATIALLSSSATIALAVRALRGSRVRAFCGWWLATL